MAKELVATVTSKGQLTLPKHVRELLHLEQGDFVRFKPMTSGILITKISLKSEDFSQAEWKTLERLARQKGKRYKSARAFLKDLEDL